ncbi:MAG: zinc dependent phospholipase C family protein [Terracidiphilus sp.]
MCRKRKPQRASVNPRRPPLVRVAAVLLALLMASAGCLAYSVLTHEEIVDLLWIAGIRPLLLERFPGLTEDQLKEAHAYAYGGSVIQDLGYYPFGSKEFSNLTHYVRTGDFVLELLRESRDVDEYAFALGALSHYASDIDGHPAVNQAVAIQYPKLRAKFGNSVRYAQDRTAHLKTEFGFDTLQVARNRYAPEQYHDFIGFQVAQPLLERCFPVVYGEQLKDVLAHEDLAVGSYRFAIGRLIPEMTQVALQTHKKDLIRETPDFARQKFLYRLTRSDYEREWGKTYTRPGLGTRILSTLLRFMPRIGPFKGLGFNNPTPQTEDLYIKSINTTVDHYGALLKDERARALVLPNSDLDSGMTTRAGEYALADETYSNLLARLSAQDFDLTSPQLRDNILQFYSNPSLPAPAGKDAARWQTVQTNLSRLKSITPSATAARQPEP